MRELKFRAWDKNKKSWFIEWDKVPLVMTPPLEIMEHVYGRRVILEQFTGKQDMNGVDIYEGDILELVTPLDPEGTCFDEKIGERMSVKWDNDSSWYLIMGGGSRAKIIGNIHEHSDLLHIHQNEIKERE